MTNPHEKMNFEESVARLEEIVALLERGDAPLNQAMRLFEEGAKVLRTCTQMLDQAEQRVTLLVQGEDGHWEEQPFAPKETNHEG